MKNVPYILLTFLFVCVLACLFEECPLDVKLIDIDLCVMMAEGQASFACVSDVHKSIPEIIYRNRISGTLVYLNG